MVDGIAGEAIQFAPRPAKQEFKQGHERVLIPLLRIMETTAPDHRLIQEAATVTPVLVPVSVYFIHSFQSKKY